jgi:hypothetical protein
MTICLTILLCGKWKQLGLYAAPMPKTPLTLVLANFIKMATMHKEDLEIIGQAIAIGLMLVIVWAILVVCSAPQQI